MMPSHRSLKILVVEDNPMNMELVRDVLSNRGHRVIEAVDAETLRVQLLENPDVILMDLQLPGQDGYALLKEIRQNAQWDKVPVAAVTAYAMQGDREKALAAGFGAVLTKPITIHDFCCEVERLAP